MNYHRRLIAPRSGIIRGVESRGGRMAGMRLYTSVMKLRCSREKQSARWFADSGWCIRATRSRNSAGIYFISIVFLFIAGRWYPKDRHSCSPRINVNELWTAIRCTYSRRRSTGQIQNENCFRNSFSLFVAQRRLTPLVISSIHVSRRLMPLLSPSFQPWQLLNCITYSPGIRINVRRKSLKGKRKNIPAALVSRFIFIHFALDFSERARVRNKEDSVQFQGWSVYIRANGERTYAKNLRLKQTNWS